MTGSVALGTEIPSKGGAVPDWIDGCDLLVCRVLQELSAQIVTNCRSFSTELQGVCSQAKEKLPSAEPGKSFGNDTFDCAEACFSFLDNFGAFSGALLQLAGDLEVAVTQPLQSSIATMAEERQGRLKHWQQVRGRFAELQERYCRSRQKSLEARKMMTSEKRWTWHRSVDGKVASEQHAAMRELAECEEELLQSEASLRELEDQSRERLRQLEHEKRQLLQGALASGAGLLRRLLPSSEKAPPPTTDEWHSVLPPTAASRGAEAGAREWLQQVDEPPEHESPLSDAGAGAGADAASSAAAPAPPEGGQEEAKGIAADPAAKYRQSTDGGALVEFTEMREVGGHSDESDAEAADAAVRAVGWSPQAKPAPSVPRKQRSLVFQSSGPSLIVESRVNEKARRDPFFLQNSSPKPVEVSTPSTAAARPAGTSAATTLSTCSKSSCQSASSTSPARESEDQQWVTHELHLPGSRRSSTAEDDDSDDGEDRQGSKTASLLDSAEVALEVTPLVAENPQRCFERYVQRMPGQLAGATETSWDNLQAKASEQILGGHVGKLEFFWIHRPGTLAGPETTEGLVCFQFVQGAACNFGRILHLSVASGPASPSWRATLPSAIFEVRRLLFGMLPIDSLRAVVLAGQDGTGPIYVDSDVEVAYQRCSFRWFQLTQNIKRRRGSLVSRQKVKLQSRFLVLHAMRGPADPRAPRSDIGRLPALLLHNEPAAAGADEAAPAEAGGHFTAW